MSQVSSALLQQVIRKQKNLPLWQGSEDPLHYQCRFLSILFVCGFTHTKHQIFFHRGLDTSLPLVRCSDGNETILAEISLGGERSRRSHIHFYPLALASPGALQ